MITNSKDVTKQAATSPRHRTGGYALYLEVEYEPEGMVENIGDMLGLVSARIFGDLNRFKDFIETKHTATGGWRGEIPASTETAGANL